MDCLMEAYVDAVNLKKTDLDLMRDLFACYVRSALLSSDS